jgi:hypothetical protein
MCGPIPPSLNKTSWHGAQLKKKAQRQLHFYLIARVGPKVLHNSWRPCFVFGSSGLNGAELFFMISFSLTRWVSL